MIDSSTQLHTAHTNKRMHTNMHRSRWHLGILSNVNVQSLIVNIFMFTMSAWTSVLLTLLTDTVSLYKCDRFEQKLAYGWVKSPAEVCLMQLDASVDAAHFRCNPNPPICLLLLEAVTNFSLFARRATLNLSPYGTRHHLVTSAGRLSRRQSVCLLRNTMQRRRTIFCDYFCVR